MHSIHDLIFPTYGPPINVLAEASAIILSLGRRTPVFTPLGQRTSGRLPLPGFLSVLRLTGPGRNFMIDISGNPCYNKNITEHQTHPYMGQRAPGRWFLPGVLVSFTADRAGAEFYD